MDRSLLQRSACLNSYIHYKSNFTQYRLVGGAADECRLGPCQDSVFARDLEHSKLTSGGILGISGSRTCEPISWTCKKQPSVSHSTTESEITFFLKRDYGWMVSLRRICGTLIIGCVAVRGDSLHANDPDQDNLLCEACEKTSEGRTKQKTSCVGGNNFGPNTLCICERQTVPPNCFEDNEAVIKRIIFGRYRTMRHVSRTKLCCI